MSFFTQQMGMDPSNARGTLGVEGGGSAASGARSEATDDFFPEYVALNRDEMQEISMWYNREPLVDSANTLKSFHNLGRFEVFFGDDVKLDDDIYHYKKPVEMLLEQARRHKDMFGFIAVRDTMAHLDYEVKKILNVDDIDEDDRGASAAAFAAIDLFGQGRRATSDIAERRYKTIEASKLIHRASELLKEPDRRDQLLGEATGSQDTQNSSFAGMQQTTVPAAATERVFVRQEARTSTLYAPNASAVVVRQPLQTRSVAERSARQNEFGVRARSYDELFMGLGNIQPVSYEDGRFYLEINRLTGKRRVVFCKTSKEHEEAEKSGQLIEDTASRKLPRTLRIDESVKVFVWPNRMPEDDGHINTRVLELIYLRSQMTASDRRLAEADETNSRPTVLLSYDEKISPETYRDMTEQEMFSGNSDRSAQRRNLDRQQAVRDFQLQVTHQVLNNKRRGELAAAIIGGLETPTVEGANGTRHYAQKGGERIVPLPRGFSVAEVVRGSTIDDIQSRRAYYQERVAIMTGVPLGMLQGGAGGTTKTDVTSSAAALSSDQFRAVVLKDREDLAMFLEDTYDVMYRSIDTLTFMRITKSSLTAQRSVRQRGEAMLEQLRKQYILISDAAERIQLERAIEENEAYLTALIAHYSEIVERARRVAAMPYRLRIKFEKLLFVSFQELQLAKQTNAISGFEYANIVRTKMSLEPFTEQEYQKIQDDSIKQLEDESIAKSAGKPAPGGGGGGGGASGVTKKRPSESSDQTAGAAVATKRARTDIAQKSTIK